MNWHKMNELFVLANWVLFVVSIPAMILCLVLWMTGHITDRAMLGITLFLSWLAVTMTAEGALLAAYVKRDMEP